MDLGKNLLQARKKSGLSQETVALKLGVSRQTISKWELNETIPNIVETQKMAFLYGISLDELINIDFEVKEVYDTIVKTTDIITEKIDWTKAWGKKYPILLKYKEVVDTSNYADKLNLMLNELIREYHFNEQDAMLVLKDILYGVWKVRKPK